MDMTSARPLEKHSAIGCGIVVFHRRLLLDGLERKDMIELTRQCLSLDRGGRKRLLKLLQESLDRPEPTDEPRFKTLYEIATGMFGNGILTGSRKYNLVLARSFIVYQMHNEGYTYQLIGKYLVRHHASAIHMYKRMENIFDYPDYYALEISYWKEFQKRLKEKDNERI
jgi:hypothetical protein